MESENTYLLDKELNDLLADQIKEYTNLSYLYDYLIDNDKEINKELFNIVLEHYEDIITIDYISLNPYPTYEKINKDINNKLNEKLYLYSKMIYENIINMDDIITIFKEINNKEDILLIIEVLNNYTPFNINYLYEDRSLLLRCNNDIYNNIINNLKEKLNYYYNKYTELIN